MNNFSNINFSSSNITNNSLIDAKYNALNQIQHYCNNTEKIEDVSEANISTEILLMMLLLCISMGGGYFLKKTRIKIINESFFATIVGLIAGAILSALENEKYINNISNAYVKFFLILLLPPIIFESAYNMKKKEFFKQIGTITIFALLGTIISIIATSVLFYICGLIGLFNMYFSFRESLAYASLISATDPVSIISAFKEIATDPNFFQIVLGESILNDAISIVFYDTSVKYENSDSILMTILNGAKYFLLNIFFSIIIGFIIGYFTAYFLSLISGKVKNIHKVEIALMLILPWVSYLFAEMLGLSGIVSIMFNGIAHATYTNKVISEWSKLTIKTAYEGLAGIFETLVFIFLGLGFFSFKHPFDQLNFKFVLIVLCIILLSRYLNIFLCSRLVNLSRKESLDNKKQFFLWFAGSRGAMAFALSIKSKIDFPESGKIFLVLTLIIASFTLIYSTLFLEIVFKKCEIINTCSADNFEESKSKSRRKNCFENFKDKINEINEKYLKRFIWNKNNDSNNSINIEDNYFERKINILRINEVKNIDTNQIKNNEKNIEILDFNDKCKNLELANINHNLINNKYQNQIDEKIENLNSNYNSNENSNNLDSKISRINSLKNNKHLFK